MATEKRRTAHALAGSYQPLHRRHERHHQLRAIDGELLHRLGRHIHGQPMSDWIWLGICVILVAFVLLLATRNYLEK